MCDPSELETTLRGSEELRQRIIRDIGSSTVALFAVFASKEGDRLELAGTGTLVVLGASYYILTAAHVWEEVLKSAAKLGITLTDNINHRYLMDVKTIVPHALARPQNWGEWGPDLVLLRIPSEYVGGIKAFQFFYDLTVNGSTALGVDHVETRVLMGTPKVRGKFTQTHADVEINGLFVNSDAPCETRGDFDYFDLEIDRSIPGLPENFGGVSGGGLWKVSVYCSCSTGRIDWVRTLEGVAFYDLVIESGRRIIRCHGPKSIVAIIPSS